MKNRLVLFFISVCLLSCSEKQQSNDQLISQKADQTDAANKVMSDEVISSIIKSVPSPLEIAYIIKGEGKSYRPELLNSSEAVGRYNTNYKRALNLGVYATDLGYINIYEKNKDALVYLNSINNLADQMSIGQFFDFATLKRLSESSKNFDSLLYISTTNFDKISDYLQEHNRSGQSVLMLTGGWVEALYLTCNTAIPGEKSGLYDRVGEQKIILDKIIQLLTFYEQDPDIQVLLKDLKDLRTLYESVSITKEYKGTKIEKVDGTLKAVDLSESTVVITKETVEAITAKITSIRQKIVA